MTIVVTGGAGFIGSHLVARLCEQRGTSSRYEPIIVLDNLSRGNAETLAALVEAGMVRLVEGDVRNFDLLVATFQGARYVYHLAAHTNVCGVESDPEDAFAANVVGTHNVLKAAEVAGVRRVIFTSSSEVYGQADVCPVPEDSPLTPNTLFGATKAAAEMCCRVAAERSGLEIVVLRLAHVYGSGDSNHVIPVWVERAVRGQDLLIYGGEQVLDFIWVGDVVSALQRAALAPRTLFAAEGMLTHQCSAGFFAALNIGTGRGTSLIALAERVCAAVGTGVRTRRLPARGTETRFVADTWRMRRALGMRPEPPLALLPDVVREAQFQASYSRGVVSNAAICDTRQSTEHAS